MFIYNVPSATFNVTLPLPLFPMVNGNLSHENPPLVLPHVSPLSIRLLSLTFASCSLPSPSPLGLCLKLTLNFTEQLSTLPIAATHRARRVYCLSRFLHLCFLLISLR
jgi:hypothetical protein